MYKILLVVVESGQRTINRSDGVLLPIDIDTQDAVDQFVSFYETVQEEYPSEDELITI